MTDSLLNKARQVAESRQIENVRKQRPEHPTGFELGLDSERGTLAGRWSRPLQENEFRDEFAGLLIEWGFDPEKFTIEDDRVEVRTWDAHYGVGQEPKKFWYYKARVIRKRAVADIDELVKRIRSRKDVERPTPVGGDRAFVVLNSDWQLGKRDHDSTEKTIEAVRRAIPAIKGRYTALRKQGYQIDTLVIANLGDLVEGCVGHYPMQTFQVELSRREQVRLARALLLEQILAWADDFEHVIVLAVAGNHGENRNEDGKSYTNLGDNDDVALVEQVAEAFDLAKAAGAHRFEHVVFRIPGNELSFTLDLKGTITGFTHGHVANGRTTMGKNLSHTKVWDWWYGQQMGRQPVADADLLISGHYHYLSVFTQGGRTALQAPPLDGGSGWYVDQNGMESMAATVTLLVGGGTEDGRRAGWEALEVIV